MDNIKVHFIKSVFDIGINEYKIIIGDNYNTKFNIIRSVIQYFEKKNFSEYQNSNNNKCYIEINENRLDIKEWDLYIVNSSFNLNNDIKLGSKSMLLKYFDVVLRDIEYNDTVNTINILMNELKDEIANERMDKINNDIELIISLQDINHKSLLKFMELSLLKEGIEASAFDLNYEQLIIFQLDIIKQISIKSMDKKQLVVIDIPLLTDRIMESIDCIEKTKLLVFSQFLKISSIPPIENICYINNTITDIASDNIIYNNILMDLPFNISIEEFKQEIINILNEKYTDKSNFILNIL